MAGRGRWGDQNNAVTINDGMGSDQPKSKSQMEDSIKPKDKYPPLRLPPLPPLPLPKEGDKDFHKLLVFQNYTDYFQNSMFFTTLPEITDGIERYGDQFSIRKQPSLQIDWEIMHRDLWPADFKKKWKQKNSNLSTSRKRKLGDMDSDDKGKELLTMKLNVTDEEDDDDDDDDEVMEDEEEEEDVEDDELDDDYNQNHCEDDDDYPGGNDGEDN